MKQQRRSRKLYAQACAAGSCGILTIVAVVYLTGVGKLSSQAWLGDNHNGGQTAVAQITKGDGMPMKPNQPSEPACQDSCFKAGDGVCDEGRSTAPGGPAVQVLCDLGTDCSDCGPWNGHLPRWDGNASGPIAFARTMNATVLIKHTSTEPAFLMPITIKEKDPDVSAMLDNYGALEGGVTRVVHEILGNGHCLRPGGARELVLDVGANFGYFALYAAMYGCRVVAWEPVELFRAYLHHGIALNNLTHLVQVRKTAISDNQTNVAVGIPKDGTYWGLASVNNLNVMAHEVQQVVNVSAERLDAAVAAEGKVLLLKVDVEGYEPQVLRSASGLLPGIQNILAEYSPGIFERSRDFVALGDLPRSLLELLQQGFAAGHLPMRIATPWPPKAMSAHYREPVPFLEEVTLRSLRLDIRAAAMRHREEGEGGGCPVPQELKRFPTWAHCREWAYATHPKSFRSSFGFNTNVWLSRHIDHAAPSAAQGKDATPRGVLKLRGQASLFDPKQDMKVWTSQANPTQSTGFMDCKGLGSGHQVIFRCPCTEQRVCAEEEAVVAKLLAQGRMPMQAW